MLSAQRIGITGALVALTTVAACKKDEAKPAEAAAPNADFDGQRGARDESCGGAREETGSLRWMIDDFTRAKTCAAERNQPLVVDLWAPWCHTCLSMKSYVFTDPSFAPFADRFVFLSADTDRDDNAELVEAYPPGAWPTFYVMSPAGEVLGRFVGAASVAQFRAFLHDSEHAFLDASAVVGTPLASMLAGDRVVVEASGLLRTDPQRAARFGVAEGHYREALAKATPDWPRRPELLLSTLTAISRGGDAGRCVDFALEHAAETGLAATATDFLASGLGCADTLAATDPTRATRLRELAVTRLEAVLGNGDAPLSADDRSDAFMYLRGAYDALGKPADALATARKQQTMLDEAAAKAPGPLAASTYNWPRAEVYAYLEEHTALVPALEKSAADLPKEYDPPYRLAWLYKEAGDVDQALAWSKKAVALAYGPRKARVQALIVDLLRAKRDAAAEIAARKELIAIYESLPPGQQQPDALDKARIDLAALQAAP